MINLKIEKTRQAAFMELPRPKGVSVSEHTKQERFNNPAPYRAMTPEKEWADLLKRVASSAMAAVTECPTVALPANVARLDDIREIIEVSLQFWLHESSEGVRSGRQLLNPFTLADYLECIRLTRQNHRCPVQISSRDAELEKIYRGIDQIAGLIASDTALVNFLAERGGK
jgi:hypothetical protein